LLLLVTLSLSIVACRPASPTPGLALTPLPSTPSGARATVLPSLTPLPYQRQGQGVIVFSLDGARADLVDKFLADGTMPNLANLAARGVKAEYTQTVDPSLTAAAHVSIATGAYPGKTGVVANTYRVPGQFIYQTTSGFSAASRVEPIWRTAMRRGLRTAAVVWVGTNLNNTRQLADYTVAFGESDALSAVHTLTFGEATGWKNAPPSYSPLQAATFQIKRGNTPVATLHLLAVDTTDDKVANFDTFVLARSTEVGPDSVTFKKDGWAALVIDPLVKSGAYFKITNADPAKFTLFQSRVMFNQVAPVELARDILARFGFFPPSPDAYAIEHGWITEQDFLDMAQRQAEWITSVAAHIYNTYQPDLLFTWIGTPDEVGHQFLLVDPRQLNYTPERAARYAQLLKRGYQIADASVGKLVSAMDLTRAALIVVSDHGMAPIHSYVNVNKVLIDKKLLVLEKGTTLINVSQTKANAVTSGGTVNVYVNLKGRDNAGSVEPDDYEKAQDEIVAALAEIKDPADGQPVFTRILKREQLAALRLDTDNSGDVFAQARPGFYPSFRRDAKEVFEPTEFYGQHGYDATLPEMRAIFIAGGAGLKSGATIGPVRAVDVAPTVARLLGFAVDKSVDGKVIEGMVK